MPSMASAVLSAVSNGESFSAKTLSFLLAAYSLGSSLAGKDPLAGLETSNGPIHKAANASLVIGILILGIVAIVGILIFASVSDAIELEDGHELEAPLNDLTDFFGESMSLIGIAMIVGVAALIISLVAGMGGRDQTSGLR